MTARPTIFLCDDEIDIRDGLSMLLRESGFDVRAFAGGEDLLLAIDRETKPLRAIFVLDLQNPPMNGDVLHDRLIQLGYARSSPVIFLSGKGTIQTAVQAVQKGALGFVEKPHTSNTLMPLLTQAIALEERWNKEAKRCDFLAYMWKSLSFKEKEVALRVAAGDANKTTAHELGIHERTVEMRRSNVYQKLGVDSPATLATTIAEMKACGIDTSIPSGQMDDSASG